MRALYLTIGIGSLLIITAMITYVAKFHSNSLSSNPDAWGQFGDYFGGIINPIIGIINVVVLIIITLKVQEYNNSQHSKALETNKAIALMSLKHDMYLVYQKEMDKQFNSLPEIIDSRQVYSDILIASSNFDLRLKAFFPKLESLDENKKMQNLLSEAISLEESGKTGPARMAFFDAKFHYSIVLTYLQYWVVEL